MIMIKALKGKRRSDSLSTTKPTWNGQELNLHLHTERLWLTTWAMVQAGNTYELQSRYPWFRPKCTLFIGCVFFISYYYYYYRIYYRIFTTTSATSPCLSALYRKHSTHNWCLPCWLLTIHFNCYSGSQIAQTRTQQYLTLLHETKRRLKRL